VQVRRGSVLETAAAAQGVNDRTCCNLGITRQLFRSIGIGGWGIAQFFLEEGWFARVTDPAIMYSYLFIEPATGAYDDLHACPISRFRRKERAVDDNEKGRRVWTGGRNG
jgi:hypothetical protein